MYSAPVEGRLRSAMTSSGFMRVLLAPPPTPPREGEGERIKSAPPPLAGRGSGGGVLLPRQLPPPAVQFLAVAAQRVLLSQQPDHVLRLRTVPHRQRVALG